MSRHILFSVILFFTGIVGISAQPWVDSPNPMAQFYKEKGWPAWSDAIKWTNRINMATYANGTNDFLKFENARDELAVQGGGVLYYPAGTYDFADHPTGPNTGRGLMLKKGVVILGEAPTTNKLAIIDSVTPGLSSLGTQFLFPFRTHVDSLGNIMGERPDVWNMIGLHASATERISQQINVGIAWVNLVGAYVYFGPDMQWSDSYRSISTLNDPNRAYRFARKSIFPGNSIAWSDRVPDGTFPGDPMCGAIKNGTYYNSEGKRFVFGCRMDHSVVTDEFMENMQNSGETRIDSLAANAIQSFRFVARLSCDGPNIFIANNAIPKSDKNFYFRQRFRRHSQVVAGSPWQTKVILFDYAKQAGIDVNKSLITRPANHCSYIDGPFVERNVVVKDNYVYNHGHKGYEIAGKWMIVQGNVNDRDYLTEGDNVYNLPPSGQNPVYELTLDCGSEAGVNSDNMARAFDMAGWCGWIDHNFWQGTGSTPGNDGEGILFQPQGGVGFFSFAETFNRQGPKGKDGYLAPWDVPVYGLFHGFNRQRGNVGVFAIFNTRIEDAAAIENYKPGTNTPNGQSGLGTTNIGDLTFTCPSASPGAPTNLILQADTFEYCIKIKWTDASENESAFRIDRKAINTDDWVTICYRPLNKTNTILPSLTMEGCFTPGPIDLNPQEWYDYLAVPGEYYEYRVVAIDCGNNDLGTTPVPPPVVFPVSVKPTQPSFALGVYPNPTSGILTVSVNQAATNAEFQLTDMTGRTLLDGKIQGNDSRLDVKNLPQGVYLITLKTYGGVATRRFVKE